LLEANFGEFDHPLPFPGVIRGPTKNLIPSSSAILIFIGYNQTSKQTPKQTDRQAKYIFRCFEIRKF